MTSYDRTYGGAGGKLSKRSSRKPQTTPYDRPITAIRPTQTINNTNNGWLSKIVDPASKLITAGAHKFFSSVFRKRLLPPPSQNSPVIGIDEGKETKDMQLEATTNVATSDDKVSVDCGVNYGSMPSDNNGVTELEDMLKQKTFTRSQIDHLTALLLTRTNEHSDDVEKERSKPNLSDPKAVHARHDKLFILPAHENRIEHAQDTSNTPELRSKVLSDDIASPAEIAKAYMGSRPTKVSPSVSRLQNFLPNEDLSSPAKQLPKSFSPTMSLINKPVIDIGTSSNGFMTPRFRGRSAIYNMARTPYSMAHPVTTNKAAETNFNTGGRSPFLTATENDSAHKLALKRRSSVLENDIGSVGPIRRIRQKPNLLHPKALSLPPSGGRQVTQVSGVRSKVHAENNLPVISNAPSQSIEMAQRIFEKLDKISPKGNLRKNADISVTVSPTKTPGVETLGSLKPLQSSQDIKKSIVSLDSVSARKNQAQASSTVEEISTKKFVTVSDGLGPGDGAEGKKVPSYLSTESKAIVCEMPVSVIDRQQKRAFQMSAHEDFLELDDDLPSNEVSLSSSLTEGKQQTESPRVSGANSDRPSLDQTNLLENSPVTKTTDVGKGEIESSANGFPASKPTASFCPSMVSFTAPATNTYVLEAISASQSALESDKVAPKSEKSNVLTASLSKFENLPPFVSTSAHAVKDTKGENPLSANKVTAEANLPDKTDNNASIFGTKVINSGDPSCLVALSNGSQPNNATPANGVLNTVPEKADASFPVTFASSSNNQSSLTGSISSPSPFTFNASNGVVQQTFGSSTSTTEPSGTSLPSVSVAAPLLTFTSGFPSPSTTLATSTSYAKPAFATGGEVPTEGTNISNNTTLATSTSYAKPAFATGGEVPTEGTNISNKRPVPGLGSTVSYPGVSASSVSASSSVSALIFPGISASSVSAPTTVSAPSFPSLSASSVSAPTSTSALSFPSQSTTSPSNFIFGLSGSTGSSSGSISGSFPANPFNSGTGTVSSGLGSSFTSSSISTSSSTTPGIFGFTSQSPKPTPTFGFESSASSTSPFVFGGTPAMTNSPFQSQTTFGNVTNQPFGFGSAPSTNNDQLTMEDTMAEDSSQPSTQPLAFGAPPAFGGAPPAFSAPSGGFAPPAAPFQFNTLQSQNTPQNPSFQPSGSLEYNNGSFSLGATDKSQRKIIKAKRIVRRK